MKKPIKNHILLPVLCAFLRLLLAGSAAAQTITNLYTFSTYNGFRINSDGALPKDLIMSSNTLYGTTIYGGSTGVGTVFAINTDGTGFASLYDFTGGGGGEWPGGELVLSGNTLYGATIGGGNGAGNLFALNIDGSGFADLYDFTSAMLLGYTNSDGLAPNYLTLSGNTLYGTASEGGVYGNGTVFAVNTDGSGFTTLHNFGPPVRIGGTNSRNPDGTSPSCGVIISSNTLYGTAAWGGSFGFGTVFKLNSDGTGFKVLHSFTAPRGSAGTNIDGAYPGFLVIAGNTIYGTSSRGGSSGYGTVFKINTDGSGFTTLYGGIYGTGRLVLSGSTLYWMAGALLAINTDGTGLTTLYNGSTAGGVSVLSGNTLYGTSLRGGSSGTGFVFSFVIPPQLTLTSAGSNVVLAWPTNATGFTLQTTTNLSPSAVWTTNLPSPVVVNGQNVVTNPIAGIQQYFRLTQ